MPTTPRYPMAAVTRRTGLSPDVLRVWERRYRAVAPARTEGGHRLYSEADLERLRQLAAATAAGFPISQVATLPPRELQRLLAGASPRTGEEAASPAVARCLAAVRAFDDRALRRELERAGLERGVLGLVEELVAPLLHAIGRGWEQGTVDPAQEHLATAAVRLHLSRLAASSPDGPALVVGTPAGQRHDIGALLAATVASADGWRAVFLGADLPAPALALAARTLGARAVALSVAAHDPWPEAELRALRALLPETALLVGGGVAHGLRPVAGELRLQLLTDLQALRDALSALAPPAAAPRAREERPT